MRRNAKTMSPLLLAIAVLSVSLQDIAAGAISPAIASMAAAYPDHSISFIQMVVTLPTLAIVLISPIYGWLSNKIQPRKVIIFGLFLFIIAGTFPVFLDNIYLIMFFRLILGCGSGITITASLAIIPVFYEGEKRDSMVGFNTAMGSLGCIFMQMLGGYFCEINWHYSFLAYLIGLFSLIMVVLFLPDIPMSLQQQSGKREKRIYACVPKSVYGLALLFAVGMTFITFLSTNISIMVEGEKIGNPANTGIALSLYTVGSAISSSLFGKLKKHLRIFVIPFGWILTAVGYFALSHVNSISSVYLSILLSGLGMGLVVSSYFRRVSEITELPYVAFAVSMIATANGLGNFIHPTVVALISKMIGTSAYGRMAISIAAYALFIIGAATLCIYALNTVKEKADQKLKDSN